jgi:hypothetical protein
VSDGTTDVRLVVARENERRGRTPNAPVRVCMQWRSNLSVSSSSMPVQPSTGESCAEMACSECLEQRKREEMGLGTGRKLLLSKREQSLGQDEMSWKRGETASVGCDCAHHILPRRSVPLVSIASMSA